MAVCSLTAAVGSEPQLSSPSPRLRLAQHLLTGTLVSSKTNSVHKFCCQKHKARRKQDRVYHKTCHTLEEVNIKQY